MSGRPSRLKSKIAWPVLKAEFGYQTCVHPQSHVSARFYANKQKGKRTAYLTSLHDLLLVRERVRRVGGNPALDGAGLDSDSTHRDAAETSTTDDDSLGPARESLLERVLVEEAREPAAVSLVGLAGQEPTRVVSSLDRRVVDRAVPRVDGRHDREHGAARRRDVAEPADDRQDTLEVVRCRQVRDTVLVHDLRATELQVRRVHLASQHLVEGARAREDDRLALDLDGTLAEADEVGTDTD